LGAVQLHKEVLFEPVTKLTRWSLLNLQSVSDVCLACSFLRVNLEVLDPSFLCSVDLLSEMVREAHPEKGRFAILGHFVQVQGLQILAVSIIDVDTLDVVEQTELELEHDVVLDRDKVSRGDLEGILRNVAHVRKLGCNPLLVLFLCVFFHLSERTRPVKNLQTLETLLQDLSVVWRQS
jgi:uncharacterized protein YfkK (UPF0435 family)